MVADRHGSIARRAAVAALLLTLVAVSLPPESLAQGGTRPMKVMTRNLYIGSDLTGPVTAPNFSAFLAATAQIYNNIQASDFPARAKVLASEIDAASPQVVALQEVELVRKDTVPPVLDGPATPSTTVVNDFLALLRAELADRGTPYDVVGSVVNSDIEAPTALGFDARVTDRDVILARAGLPEDELRVGSTSSSSFNTQLTLPSAAGPITFLRGWTAANLVVNGRPLKLVNTHLEAFSSAVRAAQAQELLAGPLNTGTSPAVLAGDMNSPPDDPNTPNAYDVLTDAGFADAWIQANGSAAGLTCCHAADLLNPSASVFNLRIDDVLTRNASAPASQAKVTGTDPDNRTPSGLWPSDHGGMWARIAP